MSAIRFVVKPEDCAARTHAVRATRHRASRRSRAAQAASRASASALIGSGRAENRAPVRWRSRKPRGVRSASHVAATTRVGARRARLEPALHLVAGIHPAGATLIARAATPAAASCAHRCRPSGATVRPTISAPVGRRTRRASARSRRQPRSPPNTWISSTASNVASPNGSSCAVRLHQTWRVAVVPADALLELRAACRTRGRRRRSRRPPPRTASRSARCRRRDRAGAGAATRSRRAPPRGSPAGAPSGSARWRSKLGATAS